MTQPRNASLLGCIALALIAGAAHAGPANAPADVYSPKTQAQPPPLRVEVIDGTHFRDIETQALYRLYGVDACASDQMAKLGRQSWPCGIMATAWLVTATLSRWLACVSVREEDGERLVRCAAGGHADLAADMLHDGVAVLSPSAPGDPEIAAYAKAQDDARKAYRGLWSSTFEMPWDWRARHVQHGEAAKRDEANP
jgi:endonuclease YncB( thermonuclease family)